MTNNNLITAADPVLDFISSCFYSPLKYVRYAFGWESGEGADTWQEEVMSDIENALLEGRELGESVRIAIASGHGIGKTTLVVWLILWAMSTRPHLRGVVTANTQTQLRDKTWAELALWLKRAINADWFEMTSTKITQKQNPDTWFVSAVPWSKERAESFAGLHAEHVLIIFDEASSIEPVIYDTAEGAMTTPGAIWCVFGNPTRCSGRFFEIHHKYKHRWKCRQIDSRTAKMTNKSELAKWIEDYGETSDFVRVRVKGQFPQTSSNRLISLSLAEDAARRDISNEENIDQPCIIGVDVARFGSDQSVIARRCGRRLYPQRKFRGLDTMTLSGIVAEEIKLHSADAVFIDSGGVGGGVVDRLNQLGFDNITGVDFGGAPQDKCKYVNKRAEMWCDMRDWLKSGMIPDDKELMTDLTAPEYFFKGDRGQVQLESKDDMRRRGLASPDLADALALTFAYPVGSLRRAEVLKVLSRVKLR